MPYCGDINDYQSKIENSNGLLMSDFGVLRCIPMSNFELYNVAGTSE